MRSIIFGLCTLTLTAFGESLAFAQEKLEVKNASKQYDLVIETKGRVGSLPWNDVGALPATVSLFRKGSKVPFQILNLRNIEIHEDTVAFNPEINRKPRGIYAEEYSLVFQDFNFDGYEDLAICTGREAGYGGPSYNVYLFHKRLGKFIENKRMTSLARGVYLGLFMVDPKKKLLLAFSKSGCCYHETEKYRVLNNRPVLVEKIIEDATGDIKVVKTRRLVKGKWVHSVRREKLEQETPGQLSSDVIFMPTDGIRVWPPRGWSKGRSPKCSQIQAGL